MRGFKMWRLVVGGFVVGGILAASTSAQPSITAGDDAWRTGEGGAEFTFDADGPGPIPADFFGPGSDPFDGTIGLLGDPLATDPAGALEGADTIIRRSVDTDPLAVGSTSDPIPVEIVALSLVSLDPIVVTYNGETDCPANPQNCEEWDVRVCLSSACVQCQDLMTITRAHNFGGTFSATIPVIPKFTFTRVSDQTTTVWDLGAQAASCEDLCYDPPLQLSGVGDNFWVLLGVGDGATRAQLGITEFGAGIDFDGDCDGTVDSADPKQVTIGNLLSNFQGGVESDGQPGGEIECRPNKEAEQRFASDPKPGTHKAFLSNPNDSNGNGVPDVCEGECCLPDGTCKVLDEDACTAAGGAYGGNDTTCDPMVACCLPNNTCITTKAECCTLSNGTVVAQCLGDSDGDGADDACAPPQAPCVGPGASPDSHDCSSALVIPCNSCGTLDPASDTTPTGPLNGGASPCASGGANDVWATFVATAANARFRTDLKSIGTDSEFSVYTVNQADVCNSAYWTEIGCSADDGAVAFLGDISIGGLVVGDTYLVQMGHWSDAYTGEFVLQIECPATGGICGDGVISSVPGGEECDGAETGDCLLTCEPNCTCTPVPTPMLPKWGLLGLALMLVVGGAATFGRARRDTVQA